MAYKSPHLAKALFSAPESFIFWTPVIMAYVIPFSFPAISICLLEIPICTREEITENATVTATIVSAGATSAGANAKICEI